MNAKHTSGPWELHEEQNDRKAVEVHPAGDEEGTAVIADVLWEGVDKEDAIANARLIASAPDLLEACETLVAHVDAIEARLGPTEWAPQVAMARAALKKAKGE